MRHVAVKCGVEAGHLGQFRMPLSKRFDQRDLSRQMIRVINRDAVQLTQQLRGDDSRLKNGVIDPAEAERRTEPICLGRVVKHNIQNHFDTGLMKGSDHLLEL